MKKAHLLSLGIVVVVLFAALVGLAPFCVDGRCDATYDSLTVSRDAVFPLDSVIVKAYVSGPEADSVYYTWSALDGGYFVEGGGYTDRPTVTWITPDTTGVFRVECEVCFGVPNYEERVVSVTVIEKE